MRGWYCTDSKGLEKGLSRRGSPLVPVYANSRFFSGNLSGGRQVTPGGAMWMHKGLQVDNTLALQI